MTDLTTKSLLQAHLGASGGLALDPATKLLGAETAPAANVETLSARAETAREKTGAAFGYASEDRRDDDRPGRRPQSLYTVLVRDRSGEQRALNVRAGTPQEAETVARSTLDEGEDVTSVSETTVPAPPDPNRGLIA